MRYFKGGIAYGAALAAALAGLLALVPAPARAAGAPGAWDVFRGNGYLAASTINDSGNILGQHCNTDARQCMWVLGLDTRCEEGDTYTVLVNSDGGATALEVHCFGRAGTSRDAKHLYAFADFDTADAIVRRGRRVGIAFPLADGRFVVERFSLDGANAVVDRMRSEAEEGADGPTGTKREVM